jgi:hypothetical protein
MLGLQVVDTTSIIQHILELQRRIILTFHPYPISIKRD